MRQQRVGDTEGRSGLPLEMCGVRTSDYDSEETGGEKYEGLREKVLKLFPDYGIILTCDTMFSEGISFKVYFGHPCSRESTGAKRPEGGAGDDMNKYELAVVVSAKIEDDERAQVIEKVKALVERFGGKISDVDEWGKKRLAYEIQKMKEGYYYFIHFESDADAPGEIEKRIRIMEGVIRYLCVRQEA